MNEHCQPVKHCTVALAADCIMGQCTAASVQYRSAELLASEIIGSDDYFRDGELSSLCHIVESWAGGHSTGSAAREELLMHVLRGQSQYSFGFKNSLRAASQLGLSGAIEGACAGRDFANSVVSAVGGNVNQKRVCGVAPIIGGLGAFAGGVVGGIGTAVKGGIHAGRQSRGTFVFIDRLFLRSSRSQAWELAAQKLELEGERPRRNEIERQFRSIFERILQDTSESRTAHQTWLCLIEVCLSLEIMRHVETPKVRQPPVAEDIRAVLRYDAEVLGQRVQNLLESVQRNVQQVARGITLAQITSRCPVEKLESPLEETCPVCLETFGESTLIRRLPCKHPMHVECCEAWLSRAGTCPICRQPVIQTAVP